MKSSLKNAARAAVLLAVTACANQPDAAARSRAEPGDPLAGFHRALAEIGVRGTRVNILQIGDSHSANDSFSGRMRELLQARFGNGGRGMLPPGIPYAYYRPAGVHVEADGFQLRRSGAEPPVPGLYGLSGIRQLAGPGASMTLSADAPDLAEVKIEALGQLQGGTIDVRSDDGLVSSLGTAAGQTKALMLHPATSPATTALTVTMRGDGPVTLLSWTAERAGPGVTWSNLGSIGATVGIVSRWNRGLVDEEAAALKPALIVLAFGTNEGFKDTTDLDAYPALFRAALRALQRAAPGASMLVAGPPGGVRAAGGGAGTACGDGRWVVPVNLPKVRAIQRRVAAEEHAAFWDWAGAMGGDCAMVAWAETVPPMAARDHVHLLQPGYRATAGALFEMLMRGMPARVAGQN